MGYVTITGDSDGDLHTAALHNAKFGAIASVLNGNVDHDNLTYPNAPVVLTFTGGPGEVQPNPLVGGTNIRTESWYSPGTISQTAVNLTTQNAANGAFNVLTTSIMKIPYAATIKSVNFLYQANSQHSAAAADNYTVYLQISSSPDGNVFTMNNASHSLNFHAAGYEWRDSNLTIAVPSLAANRYIRILIANPAANAYYPPRCTVTLTLAMKTIT